MLIALLVVLPLMWAVYAALVFVFLLFVAPERANLRRALNLGAFRLLLGVLSALLFYGVATLIVGHGAMGVTEFFHSPGVMATQFFLRLALWSVVLRWGLQWKEKRVPILAGSALGSGLNYGLYGLSSLFAAPKYLFGGF